MNSSTALVTGATSGIGKEIARQLAGLGWTVLIGGRDADRGEKTAAEVGGQPVLLDVTDEASVVAAAASVAKLDVLINNAGISLDIESVVTATGVDAFRRTYETNVFGVAAVDQRLPACAPPLRPSADREHLQRHWVADVEHRPEPAVRLPSCRHGCWGCLSVV